LTKAVRAILRASPLPSWLEMRDQRVARRIGRTITTAASLVEQHWPAICRVAKALTSDRVLSEAEIDELIASC
jgi:hypothetical protein